MELTTDLVLQKRVFANKSYKLEDTKIEGFVDEIKALKQAVYKLLSTEQYMYPIYSFNYGIAWSELIGEEEAYIRAEMKRMIEEALLRDDRILEVRDFSFEFTGDTCRCKFHISSIYGEIELEKEVSV